MPPAFTAEAHTGQQVALKDYLGKAAVVLFFYPRDGTPVCTKEACGFRDNYEAFAQAGAVVIGVSGDSLDRHRAFADHQKLLEHRPSGWYSGLDRFNPRPLIRWRTCRSRRNSV